MKTKFTPGDWQMTEACGVKACNTGRPIAHETIYSHPPGYSPTSEDEANAKLIAAAPDLAAACMAALTRQDWPVGTNKIKVQLTQALLKAL